MSLQSPNAREAELMDEEWKPFPGWEQYYELTKSRYE